MHCGLGSQQRSLESHADLEKYGPGVGSQSQPSETRHNSSFLLYRPFPSNTPSSNYGLMFRIIAAFRSTFSSPFLRNKETSWQNLPNFKP